MKKKLSLLILVFLVTIILTGCGKKYNKMVCTKTMNFSSMNFEIKYNVYYNKDNVSEVENIQKIKSNEKSVINSYKENFDSINKLYKNVKGCSYKVEVKDDLITNKIIVDYKKVDIDALIKVDSSIQSIVKDKKIRLSDIEKVYKSIGATCKK